MSRRVIVKSETDVGNGLLCLLKSGAPIHNPLKLLGRDSKRVIIVHRDIMKMSSGYFRKLLENDENLEDNTIQFPVSTNVLGIVIEFLYTKNAVSVDTGQLVELLVLADLLELDSLKSQLTAYLDSNIVDCLNAQDFLFDQPVAVVEEFIRLTSAPTREHHRLDLIDAVYAWAKRNSVEASRIVKLVGDLLDKVQPSKSLTAIVATTVQPWKTTPLFFTATGFFELNGEKLTKLQDSFNFSALNGDSACMVVKGHEVYHNQVQDGLLVLNVYDLRCGAISRSFHFPDPKDISAKLSVKFGRVYASVCKKVYVLAEEGLCLLCRTTMQIDRLNITKHDTKTLGFFYATEGNELRQVTCNRQNNKTEETLFPGKWLHLSRLDDGTQVFWAVEASTLVLRKEGVFVKHKLDYHQPTSIVSDGDKVYLKYSEKVLIVDVLTGLTITRPLEKECSMIIWEKHWY